MNVQITSTSKLNSHVFYSMSCGKQSADIAICPDHVMVVNKNASHRAWGGMGKRFENLAAAMENYKSSAMRAMIETAGEMLAKDVIAAA